MYHNWRSAFVFKKNEEKPVAVLDHKERVTRNRVVKFYKVLWSNHGEEDATWETDDYLKEVYKTFFENQ